MASTLHVLYRFTLAPLQQLPRGCSCSVAALHIRTSHQYTSHKKEVFKLEKKSITIIQVQKAAQLRLTKTSHVMRHNKHIDSRSQLNTVRLTHDTQHAVTAPN